MLNNTDPKATEITETVPPTTPPVAPPVTDPKATENPPTTPPVVPPVADPQTTVPETDPMTPPAAEGTLYTPAQLEEMKKSWEAEQAQTAADAKDFEKMTPEQKAQKLLADAQLEQARLQSQLADRDLTDYARSAIAKAELPTDALGFVKGTDQADTDARIKTFGELLAAGVQSGVEARFKQNGYTPRGTAVGAGTKGTDPQTRSEAIHGALYNNEGEI